MKKQLREKMLATFYVTLLMLVVAPTVVFAQDDNSWGPWNPVSCWKGLHFHLQKGHYNTGAQKYTWYYQFKNEYTQSISFDFKVLAPDERAAYSNGTWNPDAVGHSGRMTLTAGESQFADPKDSFGVRPGGSALFSSSTILYIVITKVHFGGDDPGTPYAVDECGHLSDNSSTLSESTNNNTNSTQTTTTAQTTAAQNSVQTATINYQQQPNVVQSQITPGNNVNKPIQNVVANTNGQQTQAYINNSQNPNNDAITSATYLLQAKINAMKQGGATMQQQQQIQQLQQQQNQANVNGITTAIGNFANSMNQIAEGKKEVADKQAFATQWWEQADKRDLFYDVINTYSKLYMDTTFLLQANAIYDFYPADADANKDHLTYFIPRRDQGNLDVEDLNNKDGIGLLHYFANMEAINGKTIDNPISKGSIDVTDGVEAHYFYLSQNLMVDTRSKKEKKQNDPDNLSVILPALIHDYSSSFMRFNSNDRTLANSAQIPHFVSSFDNYLKIFGNNPSLKLITQWLYQAKADLLFQESSNNKEDLLRALNCLDTAEAMCTLSDYYRNTTPYDLSMVLYPEYYWRNLLYIKEGKFACLNKLCALDNLSGDEKKYFSNEILILYYKTKNDLAAAFSDPMLQSSPKKIEYH